MKIVIDFEDEAIWEAADDNEITSDVLEKRLTRFCNNSNVKKMLLEGGRKVDIDWLLDIAAGISWTKL